MKPKLINKTDIDLLVRAFYSKAICDTEIGHFFTTIIPLNLEEHIPKIISFWESMILKNGAYSGSPMQVHLNLNALSPIRPLHFERWVALWCATVDELFEGENANLAKSRAHMVARSISMQLELNRDENN